MKKIRVFSIVLNFERPQETLKAVNSLIKQKGRFFHQVVIVDNSSTNDLKRLIGQRGNFSTNKISVSLIENKKNLGFAAGNNIGIRFALKNKADYICLVNDDAYLDENCLATLVDYIRKNKEVGIVSPKIYFAPGFEYHQNRYQKKDLGKVIWYAGGKIDWQNIYSTHLGVDQVDKGQFNKSEETDFATGCVMLIKKQVFEKIGLLDENYLMYWEDADFCYRAKRVGFRVYFVAQAKAWHKNLGTQKGISNKQKEKYMIHSRLRFGLKYASLKIKILLLKEFLFHFLIKTKV